MSFIDVTAQVPARDRGLLELYSETFQENAYLIEKAKKHYPDFYRYLVQKKVGLCCRDFSGSKQQFYAGELRPTFYCGEKLFCRRCSVMHAGKRAENFAKQVREFAAQEFPRSSVAVVYPAAVHFILPDAMASPGTRTDLSKSEFREWQESREKPYSQDYSDLELYHVLGQYIDRFVRNYGEYAKILRRSRVTRAAIARRRQRLLGPTLCNTHAVATKDAEGNKLHRVHLHMLIPTYVRKSKKDLRWELIDLYRGLYATESWQTQRIVNEMLYNVIQIASPIKVNVKEDADRDDITDEKKLAAYTQQQIKSLREAMSIEAAYSLWRLNLRKPAGQIVNPISESELKMPASFQPERLRHTHVIRILNHKKRLFVLNKPCSS